MQRNERWWPHLPVRLRPAPRSPTPERFRLPLIEPPKARKSTADTDAQTTAGQRQAEGRGRPLSKPPKITEPEPDSDTPIVPRPRQASGRGRPREQSSIVVNTDTNRRNVPAGHGPGRATLDPRSEERSRQPLLIVPTREPRSNSDTPTATQPVQASGRGRSREQSTIVVNTDPYRRNSPKDNVPDRARLDSRPRKRSGQALAEPSRASKPEPGSDTPTTTRPPQAIGRGLVARRGRPSASRGASRGTTGEQPRQPVCIQPLWRFHSTCANQSSRTNLLLLPAASAQ